VERCHRSVKSIAARNQCSIAEAVYWYNVAPKDGVDPLTAPANKLYSYDLRVRVVDNMPSEDLSRGKNPYQIGDTVWVKPPGNRGNTRFTRGIVSKVTSDVAVEVDGMPQHIRDLHYRMGTLSDDDDLVKDVDTFPLQSDDDSDSDPGSSVEEVRSPTSSQHLPRRSGRMRRSPNRYSP